ncbi:hypothetical protein C8J56DRAFT_893386 [Mycena floridula]|nr:hypothetical protein C8J56DRAFT_893386 [Mycena floridula]
MGQGKGNLQKKSPSKTNGSKPSARSPSRPGLRSATKASATDKPTATDKPSDTGNTPQAKKRKHTDDGDGNITHSKKPKLPKGWAYLTDDELEVDRTGGQQITATNNAETVDPNATVGSNVMIDLNAAVDPNVKVSKKATDKMHATVPEKAAQAILRAQLKHNLNSSSELSDVGDGGSQIGDDMDVDAVPPATPIEDEEDYIGDEEWAGILDRMIDFPDDVSSSRSEPSWPARGSPFADGLFDVPQVARVRATFGSSPISSP